MYDPSVSADLRTWRYSVVECLQRSVPRFLVDDPAVFISVVSDLARRIPSPRDPVERWLLASDLEHFSWGAGHALLTTLHGAEARKPCCDAALVQGNQVWRERGPDRDPRALLVSWAEIFVSVVRSTHDVPVAVRAATFLRQHFTEPVTLTSLAREVYVSRATLDREFRRRYKTSVAAFVTRLRLDEATRLLHESEASIDAVARLVGYASTKSLYAAFRKETGLTPSAVRQRSDHTRDGNRSIDWPRSQEQSFDDCEHTALML